MINFYHKYLKYKTKYLELKNNNKIEVKAEKEVGNVKEEGNIKAEEEKVKDDKRIEDNVMGGGKKVVSGSGVIIVSVINGIPCILLPREKQKTKIVQHKMNNSNMILNNNFILSITNFNIHEDIGGGLHFKNLSVEENTIFEVYEETAGYIICDPRKLKKKIVDEYFNKYYSYVDLEYKKGFIYRCYIIGIDSCYINIGQMNSNLQILNKYKNNIDKPFFECDNWTWFPINNFANNNNFIQAPHYKDIFYESYLIVNDIFNNPKFISSRTWKILLQCYNKQGVKGINLCYKIIRNINNFKLRNKDYNTTILPLLKHIPITSMYIS
jgi:hypothetical protein